MAKPPIRIRTATMADAELVWRWRNHPTTRRWCFNTAPIPYDSHREWISARLGDPDTAIYIAEDGLGQPVGVARFSVADEEAEIHVVIAPDRRGRGIGAALISRACSRLFQQRPRVLHILARILRGNTPSIRAFEKAGFEAASAASSQQEDEEASWLLSRTSPAAAGRRKG